ncbi:MAG TPA: T6SS effector amidase Tae4 family protein, partial [Duganella sp.]|nr:T6SS effector amidase Tae4 family protein [Duganella sp.]
VRANFPTALLYPRRKLLEDLLGWNDLVKNPAFADTCAMRVSVALVQSGVKLIGARMNATGGLLKGKAVEPGQAKLSHILQRLWGKPETYTSETAARDGIGKRSGVVSFFRIHPEMVGTQGHIDLVEPRTNGFSECATQCYFQSTQIWFWPLK